MRDRLLFAPARCARNDKQQAALCSSLIQESGFTAHPWLHDETNYAQAVVVEEEKEEEEKGGGGEGREEEEERQTRRRRRRD